MKDWLRKVMVKTQSNNSFNRTRHSAALKLHVDSSPVNSGVRLLMFFKIMAEACGWQRRATPSRRGARIFIGAALRVTFNGAWREVRRSEYRGWWEARAVSKTPPNKPMHPTADTNDVIKLNLVGRRVIGGVGRLS
jgi:hypothetical protein